MSETLRSLRHLMAPIIRRDTINGRPHLVVPTVLITNGVHNKVLYRPEDLSMFPESWNGRPIVLNHPQRDGKPITANDKEVIEKQTFGLLLNVRYVEQDGKSKLKGDAWLDVERMKDVAPEVHKALVNNERIEVSTGLFTEDLITNGEDTAGDSYDVIATAYRPDHLAILPGGKGACSWEDGAGMPRVNEAADPKNNGGDGSGNFGHAGVPGQVGGSAPAGGSAGGVSAKIGRPHTPISGDDKDSKSLRASLKKYLGSGSQAAATNGKLAAEVVGGKHLRSDAFKLGGSKASFTSISHAIQHDNPGKAAKGLKSYLEDKDTAPNVKSVGDIKPRGKFGFSVRAETDEGDVHHFNISTYKTSPKGNEMKNNAVPGWRSPEAAKQEFRQLHVNDLSLCDLGCRLMDALVAANIGTYRCTPESKVATCAWVVDVYPHEGYFIFSYKGQSFRMDYTADGDNVTLEGEAVPVRRVITYEDMDPADAEVQPSALTVNTNSPDRHDAGDGGNKTGVNTMDRKAMIQALTTNSAGPFNAENIALLEGMSDAQLKVLHDQQVAAASAAALEAENKKLKDNAAKPPAKDPKEEDPEDMKGKKPAAKCNTAEEFLATAPAELRDTLTEAITMRNNRRTALITGIKNNERNEIPEAELNSMSIPQLERTTRMLGLPVINYGVTPAPAQKQNAEQGAPPPPALFEETPAGK